MAEPARVQMELVAEPGHGKSDVLPVDVERETLLDELLGLDSAGAQIDSILLGLKPSRRARRRRR